MAPKHDSKTESGSRWSIEEVKNLFMAPFGGGRSSREKSDRSSGGMSFSGLRWSLEDVVGVFSRSSRGSNDKKKKRKGNLSPEERKQRRLERQAARKEKKSAREKARRSEVNGLFDQLGNMLHVERDDKKGARLSILSAAVDKLKEKKGLPRDGPGVIMEDDEDDYYDDDL